MCIKYANVFLFDFPENIDDILGNLRKCVQCCCHMINNKHFYDQYDSTSNCCMINGIYDVKYKILIVCIYIISFHLVICIPTYLSDVFT